MEDVASNAGPSDGGSVNDIVLFKSGGSNAAATGESAATPAVERDEGGRFKGKADETASATTTTTDASAAAPVAADKAEAKVEAKTEASTTAGDTKPQKDSVSALIAMRQRLQAAENRVRELEAGGGKAATPDIFTEPEKAVQELVAKQVAPIKARFFTRSIEDAQKAHTDFDDAYSHFEQLLDANPALLGQLQQSDDPGAFIYLVGSATPQFREATAARHRETVSAKDAEIAALKSKLTALEGAQAARNEVPESLNRQPSGAVPSRDGDALDISKIVRFKSG